VAHRAGPVGFQLTETQLQTQLMRFARDRGWLAYHALKAQIKPGVWVTPMIGDKGLPDVILARRGVIWFFEIKGPHGSPDVGQKRWLEALGDRARVVRPEDWDEIARLLR
jgi:hypothetical protein